jgi:hypothetical protein
MFVCLMGFNGTFNNISVISWLSVLLVEETGGQGETHRHRVKQGTIIQRIFPFDTERITSVNETIFYVGDVAEWAKWVGIMLSTWVRFPLREEQNYKNCQFKNLTITMLD